MSWKRFLWAGSSLISPCPLLPQTHPSRTHQCCIQTRCAGKGGFPFGTWGKLAWSVQEICVYGENRDQEKNSFLLWWLSSDDSSYLHMYRFYGREYATPPQHCFLFIILISNCKIRQWALAEREILFLGLIDMKKQKNYSSICSPCASEPTHNSLGASECDYYKAWVNIQSEHSNFPL